MNKTLPILLFSGLLASSGAGATELIFRSQPACNAKNATYFWGFANSLVHSVAAGTVGRPLRVCASDPDSLNCNGQANFPFKVGAAPVLLTLSTVEFEGAGLNPNTSRLDFTWNMRLHANQMPLTCSRSQFTMIPNGKEIWTDNFESLSCNFGLHQQTGVKAVFKLDTLDMERGVMGGRMCLSAYQQAESCKRNGMYKYVIIQFPTPVCPKGASADQLNSVCAFTAGDRCHMISYDPINPPDGWQETWEFSFPPVGQWITDGLTKVFGR
ncbi:hypothetical protein FACS1894186_5010 [Alphaproteobacteria bacterium]|nr:hypothetical protein FACS1894186_5010 [Alphaproteobacteria bacterium]